MATVPDRSEKTVRLPVPINGLNTVDDSSQMPDNMASDLENVEITDYRGINKRNGYTLFNTQLMPVTLTGAITSVSGTFINAATGVVWSGVATAGMRFRMASGTNIYTISGLASNARINLTSSFIDTVSTGSYVVSPPGVYGLTPFKYGATQKLVAFGGGTVFDGGSGTTGTFTNLWDLLTSGTSYSTTTFQDKLYYCNGYQFHSWDGTTIASVAGTPAPSDPLFVDLYVNGNANYLVIGGSETAADRSRVSFAEVNDPTTWPAANKYLVGDRDGGRVVAGTQVPTGYLILKDNGIFMYGGIPGSSGSLRKVSEIGCVARHSVVEYEGKVYFVGTRDGRVGVFAYLGGNTIIALSDSIDPTLNELKMSNLGTIVGTIYRNKYYLSATSEDGTFNDSHFVCYINRPFRGADNRLFFPWVKGDRGFLTATPVSISGQDMLFTGSPTSGFINREDNGTSDDTTDTVFGNTAAINAYLSSKYFDFGDSTRGKDLRNIRVNVNAVGKWNLELSLFKDFQSYGSADYLISLDTQTSVWEDVIFLSTPWQTATGKAIPETGFRWTTIGKWFKFRWRNVNADEPFSVFPFDITYKMEAR